MSLRPTFRGETQRKEFTLAVGSGVEKSESISSEEVQLERRQIRAACEFLLRKKCRSNLRRYQLWSPFTRGRSRSEMVGGRIHPVLSYLFLQGFG